MKNGSAIKTNWLKKFGLAPSAENFKPMSEAEIDTLAAETVLKHWEKSDRELRAAIDQVAHENSSSC